MFGHDETLSCVCKIIFFASSKGFIIVLTRSVSSIEKFNEIIAQPREGRFSVSYLSVRRMWWVGWGRENAKCTPPLPFGKNFDLTGCVLIVTLGVKDFIVAQTVTTGVVIRHSTIFQNYKLDKIEKQRAPQ